MIKISSSDYKEKRITYQNEWPNSNTFYREKEYICAVNNFEENYDILFKTVNLKVLEDKNYNIVVSFLIEALDDLRKKPLHSFLFAFMALDHVSKEMFGDNITVRLDSISECVSSNYQEEFEILNKIIPLRSCKYIRKQLEKEERVIKRINRDATLKCLVEKINEKYHNNGIHNEKEIADTNRKEACLYQKIIRDNLKNATYQIEHSKRCKLVLSGYLYALRNDISHGSVISDTKSSTTRFNTFASDYWAFMYTYYVVIALIKEKWAACADSDYKESIQINNEKYKELFKNGVET